VTIGYFEITIIIKKEEMVTGWDTRQGSACTAF
jgi:hypothetical protein